MEPKKILISLLSMLILLSVNLYSYYYSRISSEKVIKKICKVRATSSFHKEQLLKYLPRDLKFGLLGSMLPSFNMHILLRVNGFVGATLCIGTELSCAPSTGTVPVNLCLHHGAEEGPYLGCFL